MIHPERQYLDLLEQVLTTGEETHNERTGTGTKKRFGTSMRFDLREGFPLLTTKRIHVRSVIGELLWMISGSTNNTDLEDQGIRIWREWADPETGDLGPIYGAQWRDHVGVRRSQIGEDGRAPVIHTDQLQAAVDTLRADPGSRRIILDAWNVSELPDMHLTPCHAFLQYNASGPWLDAMLTQRSADIFLGVPFNIAFYAAKLHMMAQVTGLKARELVWCGGDTHIYLNHEDAARRQLAREPFPWPTLRLNPEPREIGAFVASDFEFVDYQHHKGIKATVSV